MGINGVEVIHGGKRRVHAITFLLQTALFLEPVNIFLYTWRFLPTLEAAEQSQVIKRIYRWVACLTIAVIPLSFYFVFAALVFIDPMTYYSTRAGIIYYKL